jgi:hypothetical protein
MRWPTLSDLPVPDTLELHGKDAFEAMVQHFGMHVEDTVPAGLDVIKTEDDMFRERLRRAGLAVDVNLADVWEGAR